MCHCQRALRHASQCPVARRGTPAPAGYPGREGSGRDWVATGCCRGGRRDGSGRRRSPRAGRSRARCLVLATTGRPCGRHVPLPLVPGACALRTRHLGWSSVSCDGTQTFVLPPTYRNPGTEVFIHSCVRGLNKGRSHPCYESDATLVSAPTVLSLGVRVECDQVSWCAWNSGASCK